MHVFLGLAGKTPDDLSQGSPVRKRERLRKIQDPGKKKKKGNYLIRGLLGHTSHSVDLLLRVGVRCNVLSTVH